MKKIRFRSILALSAAALALTRTFGFASTADAGWRGRGDDSSSSGGGGGGRWDDDSSSSGCSGRSCGGGGGGGGDPVPEIDPNAARAAAVMLAGGLAVVRYRKGR